MKFLKVGNRGTLCWIPFAAFAALVPLSASAATKDADNGISRPRRRICWEIEDEFTDVEYTIVPYDVISPEGHAKCRELIGGDHDEAGKGFMFFVVIVDNHKGDKPTKFNAFGGDAHFYYYPPRKPNSDPKTPPPAPKKYGFVSLKNYFADTGNTPKDKVGYKQIKRMFKTKLIVPPGSYGWSLACIRDSFIYDLRRNKVTWAIPGEIPQPMELKRSSKRLLRKANVEVFED